jgi:hypothetical protein
VMSYNLPAGSGFGVGFIGGLRSGWSSRCQLVSLSLKGSDLDVNVK